MPSLDASRRAPPWIRWSVVVAFSIAMAWVEAACVYDLRLLVDRVVPYQPSPLPMHDALGHVELVREAATLVMLATVGMLAGGSWRARFGYAAVAFGVWDVFYYVFLRIITGWPASLFDWDILFLLPLPWWGPVIAPVLIACLMIVWGTLAVRRPNREPAATFTATSRWIGGIGIVIALYAFMADSLRALVQGLDVTEVLPTHFNWLLFSIALALMAAGFSRPLSVHARWPRARESSWSAPGDR